VSRNRRCRGDRQLERQVEQLTRTVRKLEREVRKTRDWETALDVTLNALTTPAHPARPSLRVAPPRTP
jgi:glutamate/tyrosine decarboxylase-like PLP-dependent enzyme